MRVFFRSITPFSLAPTAAKENSTRDKKKESKPQKREQKGKLHIYFFLLDKKKSHLNIFMSML